MRERLSMGDLFCCCLDDQPDHLAPEPQTLVETSGRPLFLNPRCCMARGDELPEKLRGQEYLVEKFASRRGIAWVAEPGSEALWPFWLNPGVASRVSDGVAGGCAPRHLSQHALATLAAAGVLAADDSSRAEQDWLHGTRLCAGEFAEKGYVPLRQLIHPFQVSALRRYYRTLIRRGELRFGDSQCPKRYAAHNESVARFFHRQLTATVTAVVGEAVKPSYVYFACYADGSDLEEHVDRPQCEFSITFCLDYSPQPSRETAWPLQLRTARGTVSIFQAIGDGLLYRGHRLPHFRGPLPKGHSSTSLFFHYVREDFSGGLD